MVYEFRVSLGFEFLWDSDFIGLYICRVDFGILGLLALLVGVVLCGLHLRVGWAIWRFDVLFI